MNRFVMTVRRFGVAALVAMTATLASSAAARADDATPFTLLGNTLTVEVPASQTHGAATTIVEEVAPKSGPPLHVHTREDETYVVTRGHFRFTRGNETFDGGPGSVVFLPRHIPHTFENLGTTPGQMVFTLMPAGLETMFRTISQRRLTIPKNIREIVALGKDYGITYLPPKNAHR